MKQLKLLVAGGVILALLAACGRGEAGDDTPQGGPDGSSSGDPIVVYVLADVGGSAAGQGLGEMQVGAQAAAEHVNKDLGGVDGREIQVETCDTAFDPAAAIACVNDAIADKAVAVTGNAVGASLGASGIQALNDAGIPWINTGFNGNDLGEPGSYPIAAIAAEYAGQLTYWAGTGAKSATILTGDLPSIRENFENIQKPLAEELGLKVNAVFYDLNAGDLTPYVAQAVESKPDILAISTTGAAGVPMYRAIRSQGWDLSKVVNSGSQIDEKLFFSQMSDEELEGTYFTSALSNPEDNEAKDVAVFTEAMDKYAQTDGPSYYYQVGFAEIMTITNGLKELDGDISAAAFGDLLENDIDGTSVFMGGELSTQGGPEQFPRLLNDAINILRFEGGKLVTVEESYSAWGNK